MKVKRLIRNIILAVTLMLPITSCSEWLKVEMEDGIMEDALFEDNEGYLAVLNGVYSKMNQSYSSFLSMGAIDVMAQYYNVQRNSEHPYYVYANYKYDDTIFDSASGALWSNLYSLILNLNVLLENCDSGDSALSKQYYGIVKGEALALRAMMHFDMLRLYGPIYSESTAEQRAIPYLKDTERVMQEILSASKVVEFILGDLSEASKLLEDDPIRTEGVNSSDVTYENNDFRYRQYRLNYYAVQGLLARVYMWIGEKEKAHSTALNLITEIETNETFPWVTRESVTGTATTPQDLVFSTEVMFALYNVNRENIYDALFNQNLKGNGLSFAGGVSGSESVLESFYGIGNTNDFRRTGWEQLAESYTDESGVLQHKVVGCFMDKYKDVDFDRHFRYMIPLMRTSEMYLILAETADNVETALSYINKVRSNRSAVNIVTSEDNEITTEDILPLVISEFAREVLGEGQLFFLYKRLAITSFATGTAANVQFNMDLPNYVVPLPTIETNIRE